MVSLTVNGKPTTLESPLTLLAFLEQRQINPHIIAVERNGDIVRRGTYDQVTLQDGDRLEIVRMVGGGAKPSLHPEPGCVAPAGSEHLGSRFEVEGWTLQVHGEPQAKPGPRAACPWTQGPSLATLITHRSLLAHSS